MTSASPAGTMLDLIIVAGGAARRLGGVSKGEVHVAGRAMLDHVLAAAAVARRAVIVGPESLARPGVPTVMEHPPGGGPVAAIEAGLHHLHALRETGGSIPDPGGSVSETGASIAPISSDHLVAVLACDGPRAPSALDHLRAALTNHPHADGAHLTDGEGRSQLVMVVRAAALTGALARLGATHGTWGCSIKRLVAELDLVDVPDAWGYGRDADTWQDVRALDALLEEESHGRI